MYTFYEKKKVYKNIAARNHRNLRVMQSSSFIKTLNFCVLRTRLESMLCVLKIFRAQIICHARNGQSSAQSLKKILVKRAGTYKKVLLHMRSPCEGGFSKRANLTGKNIFRTQKTNFPVWITDAILIVLFQFCV